MQLFHSVSMSVVIRCTGGGEDGESRVGEEKKKRGCV